MDNKSDPPKDAGVRSSKASKSKAQVTNLGNGYNTFFATAMATCVSIDSAQTGKTSSSSRIYVCTSTEQIYKALGIDAAMHVDGGWGTFSDRLKFVRTMGLTTTSVAILVVATVISSTETASTWSWLPNQPPGSANNLYQQGGDCFISSVTKGGQYLASYTFNTTDEESFTSISNEANLEFSGWGTDFAVDFNVRMQNITSTATFSSNFDQTVIGFNPPSKPTNMADMMTFVESISTLPVVNPAVFDYSTTSYSAVNPPPSGFSQVDNYRSIYVDPNGSIPGLSDYELTAKTNRTIIQTVSDLCNRYGCSTVDDKLSNVPSQLDTIIANIAAWRLAINQDPSKAGIDTPNIDTSLLIIPYPQYGPQVQAAAGGTGGGLFSDVSINNVLQGVLPSQIVIRGGSWIDRITTTYEVLEGNFNQPAPHGGGGGGDSPPIQFGPGELVTSITAASGSTGGNGTYVHQLAIATNFNPNPMPYPSHPDSTSSIVWNTPANGCFIGWTGLCGEFLDSIAPFYVVFQPCNWVRHPPVKIN